MSLDVVGRVLAICNKADELCDKGHLLRAAEYYGRAAEEARALGEDNFVALRMLVHQGDMLGGYAAIAPDGSTDPHIIAASRVECIALLSSAVEALERRRVAGTLLEGKCTAAEEAWFASALQQRNAQITPAQAGSLASQVGYEQFMRAAANAVNVLFHAQRFAAECSDAQFQSFAQHVVLATELMQQPRLHSVVAMKLEALVTEQLHNIVAKASAIGLDARLVQLLADALQRLQRSGVMQSRSFEKGIELNVPEQRALSVALQKSLNAPGLRTCVLPGCGAKEAHPAHFKSCAACRGPVYVLLPRAPGGGLAEP